MANRPPQVNWNGFFAEGYILEPGSTAEAVLARSHQQVFSAPLQSFVTPGYLDNRVHVLYDCIPSLCYGPNSKDIHGIDERVEIESVRRITKTMALFIAEWCGVERNTHRNTWTIFSWRCCDGNYGSVPSSYVLEGP